MSHQPSESQIHEPGFSLEERLHYVFTKLTELRDSFKIFHDSMTIPIKAAPNKAEEGMFAFADGTNWNPGAGRGLYQYVSGAWVKL